MIREVMGMEKVIENFIAYMREAKKASQNTEISYERDLKKLARYLRNQKIMDFSEVTKTDLQGYLKDCRRRIWHYLQFPEILHQ